MIPYLGSEIVEVLMTNNSALVPKMPKFLNRSSTNKHQRSQPLQLRQLAGTGLRHALTMIVFVSFLLL